MLSFKYTTGISELPRYENMARQEDRIKVLSQQGVTLLEYIIVVLALALLFMTYYAQFAPKSFLTVQRSVTPPALNNAIEQLLESDCRAIPI